MSVIIKLYIFMNISVKYYRKRIFHIFFHIICILCNFTFLNFLETYKDPLVIINVYLFYVGFEDNLIFAYTNKNKSKLLLRRRFQFGYIHNIWWHPVNNMSDSIDIVTSVYHIHADCTSDFLRREAFCLCSFFISSKISWHVQSSILYLHICLTNRFSDVSNFREFYVEWKIAKHDSTDLNSISLSED